MNEKPVETGEQKWPFADRTAWNPIGGREVLLPKAPAGSPLARWKDIAKSNKSVLITGETGTGKEELANLLAANSPRGHRNYFAVNCVAMEGKLFASLLFGHKKGSFTDAQEDQFGLLASLNNGTILLDEIGELAPHDQAVLLRFLQSGQIEPIGGRPRRVDVRVIATTNANIDDPSVFRSDLRQRFGYHLSLPPLRERPNDIIPALCVFLWPYEAFTAIDIRLLLHILCCNWPGNLRDLRYSCDRALELSQTNKSASPVGGDTAKFVLRSLPEFELPAETNSRMHYVLRTYLRRACGFASQPKPVDGLTDPHIGNFNKLALLLRSNVPEIAHVIDSVPHFAMHPGSIPLRSLAYPSALLKCYNTSWFFQLCVAPSRATVLRHWFAPDLNLMEVLLMIRHFVTVCPADLISAGSNHYAKVQAFVQRGDVTQVLRWLAACKDELPDYGATPIPSGRENLALSAILDQLKPSERRMVEMRSKGVPYRKIAKELGLGHGTVYQKLVDLRGNHPGLFGDPNCKS